MSTEQSASAEQVLLSDQRRTIYPDLWNGDDDWRVQLAALLRFQDECVMRMRAAGPMLSSFMARGIPVVASQGNGEVIVIYPLRTETTTAIFMRSIQSRSWSFASTAHPESNDARQTAVYLLFDANGELLYVGITVDLQQRMSSHAREKYWWHKVASREVVWCSTRADALSVERLCINKFNPKHNKLRPAIRYSDIANENLMPQWSGAA